MGYGADQMKDLEETINNSDVDLVLSGTPIDLNRIIKLPNLCNVFVMSCRKSGNQHCLKY